MSSNPNAFPFAHEAYGIEPTYHEGMTLRDYFAAKELSKTSGCTVCGTPEEYGRLADHCYRMADAMLAARGEA